MPISIQDAIHIWTDKKLDGVNIPAGTERWPGEPVD